jgi:hypothetical protein
VGTRATERQKRRSLPRTASELIDKQHDASLLAVAGGSLVGETCSSPTDRPLALCGRRPMDFSEQPAFFPPLHSSPHHPTPGGRTPVTTPKGPTRLVMGVALM